MTHNRYPGPMSERVLETADGRSYSEEARRQAVDRAIELRSGRAAADELGCGLASILNWAVAQGRPLSEHHRNGFTAAERERAVALVQKMDSVADAAEAAGFEPAAVRRWCQEAGVALPPPRHFRAPPEQLLATVERRRRATRARERARHQVCRLHPRSFRVARKAEMAREGHPPSHTVAYSRAVASANRQVAARYPRDFRRLLNAERATEGLPPVGA